MKIFDDTFDGTFGISTITKENMDCILDQEGNIYLSLCPDLPGVVSGFFETPSNFSIPIATLSDATLLKAYMQAAMKLPVGGIMLLDMNGKMILKLNSAGDGAPLQLSMLNPEKLKFSDGSVATESPVLVSLKRHTDIDEDGVMVDVSSFLDELVRLADVVLTNALAQTTTVLTIKVAQKCDQTPIIGLITTDFVIKTTAGATQASTSFLDNGDGTYTSVLSDGKFHVLPLTSTSLGAPLLGFISSTKAGAINQFAALGKLKDRIGGVTNSGGTVTTGTATNYGGGTGDLLNPAPAPSIGDPMNPPRPAGTYTSGTCPPTPPNWDDSKYHPDIPLVGGAAGPLVFLADQIAYFGTYAVCALTAVVKFVTTPGYWWRLLFVLAGVGLVVVGGKTYLAGDLPQVLQSVGK